jgi:hypothetical protein
MPDGVKQFEELAAQLEKLEAPEIRTFAPGTKVDICPIWKVAKPIVEIGIKLLNLLPFAWAKTLAKVLQLLDNALSALCP